MTKNVALSIETTDLTTAVDYCDAVIRGSSSWGLGIATGSCSPR
jgi:hypothetical protein